MGGSDEAADLSGQKDTRVRSGGSARNTHRLFCNSELPGRPALCSICSRRWRAGDAGVARCRSARGQRYDKNPLEHDPEKWAPVFGKRPAPAKAGVMLH